MDIHRYLSKSSTISWASRGYANASKYSNENEAGLDR